MDAALRSLNRFGLGARIGEAATIGADPRGWLLAQLDGGAPAVAAPPGVTPDTVAEALRALRMPGQASERERQQARQRLLAIGAAEAAAGFQARLSSDRPFVERLVAFWSNHLCVSVAARVNVAPLAGGYERDVVRRHVLGSFEAMVLASGRHPAMLFYLDNFQSIGPASAGAQFGRRAGVERGLNENYARELLELHTLGVAGGYTQGDVIELARALTGWTVAGVPGPGALRLPPPRQPGARVAAPPAQDGASGPVRFLFHPALHEPGARTVLGERYAEAGVEQGERAIRALCRHPSTARFVATKLVTHFVDDAPPAAAVDRVERRFRESGGDLRAVAEALVALPDAWEPERRKFRPPQEWLVAALRALDVPAVNAAVPQLLRGLRQPLWAPPSPKGYGDAVQDWADPDALLRRAELARTIARRAAARRGFEPRQLLQVVDVPAADPLRALLADRSIAADERVALAIGGPAFQWR